MVRRNVYEAAGSQWNLCAHYVRLWNKRIEIEILIFYYHKVPCSVPSTEHGSYYTVTTDATVPNAKPIPKILNAFDEILNGDIIDVQCDDGYNVQGLNQLKCWQGTWDTTNMPECLPAPCILPNIANAVYRVNILVNFPFFFWLNESIKMMKF